MFQILFIIVTAVLVIGVIVSQPFRNGFVKVISDIAMIIFGVTRAYALIAGSIIVVMFEWVVFALIIGSPIFSGLVFLTAISIFFIVWLPLGVVLKIFKTTDKVVPASVRSFFAWLAFLGFLAMMTPDVFTMKTTLIAALVAIFLAMLSSKFNLLEKVVMPLVLIMCLIGAWKIIAPDSFRATERHRNAIGAIFTTANDRGSFRKETNAAATFAKIIKDTKVVYNAQINGDSIVSLTMMPIPLLKGDIVLLCNQKKDVYLFQGQSFTEIRMPNAQGTYVNGNCYWIESNLLQIGTMAALSSVEVAQATSPVGAEELVSLGIGTHNFFMVAGETSKKFHILSNNFCISTDESDKAVLMYEDSRQLNLWQLSVLPNDNKLKIKSLVDQTVTIKVL